jgi:multicomponent Na+:H+ antiporter subunit B|tara:strand:- start:328 stop:744 length:417 start_codon:yes stop_codon:yes gene_type:complete
VKDVATSTIVKVVCRRLVPFVQIFGLYVIMHGHSSPGGGFQGGVILASSFMLLVLSDGLETVQRRFSVAMVTIATSTGVLLYAGVGVLCLLLGANYLDYSVLPSAEPRSLGMLVIEVGVGITVTGALVSIFYDLLSFE